MANCKEIGSWLIANSKHLNLKVAKASWVKDWIPNHKHVRVEVNINGVTGIGTGIDISEDLALVKAGSEAIERVFCIQNGKHSTGIAAHVETAQAKENAMLELMERDVFLSHYLTREPFIIENEIQNSTIEYEQISKKLQSLGVDFDILKMKTEKSYYGYVCFASPSSESTPFSSIIGLGFSKDKNIAIEKSIIECLLNTIFYLHNKNTVQSLSSFDFNSKLNHGPTEHRELFLGSSYQGEIKKLISTTTNKQVFDDSQFHFEFQRLLSDSEILLDSPFKVYQATSTNVQNIFYGPTNLSLLNINRLEQFKNEKLNMEDLNMLPHCLG